MPKKQNQTKQIKDKKTLKKLEIYLLRFMC